MKQTKIVPGITSTPSATWRGPDDYTLPLYVTPHKALWYHRFPDGRVVYETRFDDNPAKRWAELSREAEEAKQDKALERQLGMKKVASVPMSVYLRSKVENWDTNDWKKWANDPDNKHLRVWNGVW